MTTITLAAVAQFNDEYERASRLVFEALERRNAAVLELLESGISQADIARAMDVSPGRVSQIVAAARRRRRELVPA